MLKQLKSTKCLKLNSFFGLFKILIILYYIGYIEIKNGKISELNVNTCALSQLNIKNGTISNYKRSNLNKEF